MTVWLNDQPLILASQSATRQMLLRNAGLVVEAIPAAVDERHIQKTSGLTEPSAIASLLARAKASDVARGHQSRIVLGADQTLSCDGRLFNKAANREQAADHLQALAGKTHQLQAALAVMRGDEVLFETVSVANMTMRAMSDAQIAAYLDAAGDGVLASVGCYQLEGLGVHLFERIEGDHFTILGLPLLALLPFLRNAGWIAI
jgi:septum formation protein